MPIYEYQCQNPECRRLYDQLESSNAPKNQPCVDCGGLAIRLMSAPSIGRSRSNNSDSTTQTKSDDNEMSHTSNKKHPGIGIVIGIGIPVPSHIADSIINNEKRKRAAPYN